MHDLPNLTVARHHFLCLGVLAQCYPLVGPELQAGIREAIESAKTMGAPVIPENLVTGKAIATLYLD